MIDLDLMTWILLACGALIVGLSKTAVPGAGALAVAVFAAALPARESTAALLVLLIVGDLFAVWMYRRDVDWATLRRLVPAVLVGLLVGAAFLGLADDAVVRRVIGTILLALLVLTLWRRRTAAQPSSGRAAAFGYGWLGGFTTMVANAGGAVMSMYLLAKQLPVRTFLGTAAWFFFAINLTKVPFQIGLGLLDAQVALIAAVLVPGVVISACVGRWLAVRISQRLFDRLVLVLTAVGALNLLL
ncbi:sulfite exporter TauE/SafE family protein [Nesterenkonia halophila]|uniref:sulfite exporter TauE/SafE family protein n=1 Tax=Nesterenkonia halophila TaxID=302044 RepID=UPI001FE55B85|nr:sulfite exporter TauE/SafE family protein [Nesterenkonia halophila]